MEILIFQLIVLLFSVVIHEVSHGVVAEHLGDPTARLAGRLTLNPIKHLDLFGSFLLPLSLYFISGGGFIFGWAKPVPYNPLNLKNPEKGGGLIAAAGPISNFVLAVIFSFLYRFLNIFSFEESLIAALGQFFIIIILVNIMLGVFNLVPLPPLDGSKVLFALLPRSASQIRMFLERYGLFLLFLFIFFGFKLIMPIVFAIY